ncbi:WD-40 repeat protein [Candidatus Moduliflexus flocculans]|uniref:WD-40 repeat protein n=1 Tax=Candidatus Moduliflexus flocculans TaxID=1499966 RepID=A0A081BTI3_9BACT|nr:WD-40 repeat protein [Candidatus Moduliflexus flocculans]
MDTLELIRLIRESYPFPIAHAHKKTLGVLENEEKKLTCLFQTAETTIQFLALLALAQVRQDIISRKPVPNLAKLREKLNLATPSLGKWSTMARETMKAYWNSRDQLAVPELFDLFWSWDAARQKIGSKPINNTAIAPLIELRNNFHHGRIQSHQIPDLLPTALDQLHRFLAAIRFVAEYQLVFTNRILLDQEQEDAYLNELMLFTGCFSAFDSDRWKSAIRLKPDAVVFLHPQTGRHLVLSPFIAFTNQFNGLPDLLVINSLAAKEAEYVATLFGHVAKTAQPDWADGAKYFAALNEFVTQLQQAADAAAPAELPQEETAPAPVEDDAPIMRKAAAPSAAPHTQHASPYKFLDYYNPEDADIFFGRDREIRLLEQKFHNTRLLVLHGESGTGKTSLIRAGLMPRLSPEVFVPVYVRVLHDPLREIKRELLRQLALPDEHLLDKPFAEFLTVVTERVSKTVIIVFDQFEEFFLRFDDEARRRVIAELAACLTETRLDVKFLIAIRSDYFALLAAFEEAIPQVFTHQIHLERLTEAQAVEAVIKPAERLGIQVDEPMVQIKLLPELLAKDGGIEPPLLQIVCDALYQHAQNDGRSVVDMRDYEAVGDVTGALGNYLHEKLRQFGKHQATARAALKALVTAEGTKRASFVPELCSRISSSGQRIAEEELRRDYLDKFVRDRLVRVDDVEGQARYELSHDYLARHIEAWIEESERELTKALELIDRAYETYQATRVLLERSALQALKPFETQLALPPEKQAFLDRSKTETRKQRRGLWLKVAAALMAVALIVGGGFGYRLYQSYQETQQQRDLALAEEQKANAARQTAVRQTEIAQTNLQQAQINEIEALNQSAKALFLSHDELGALLAGIKANKQAQAAKAPADLHDQINITVRDIVDEIAELNRLEGHADFVIGIAFSPDGTLLASSSADGTLKLWNVADGKIIRTLYGHAGWVVSVSFSPDGKLLASGGADKTIKLWNVPDGSAIRTLYGHSGSAASLSFSPDGSLLASGSLDNTVKLWQVSNGAELRTLQGHTGSLNAVSFSPDGTLLASGGADKIIRLWQVADGKEIRTISGHTKEIFSLSFSPDGALLASSGKDKTVRLWNVSDGSKIRTFQGHARTVRSVSFSPDGEMLASSSEDKTVKIWKVADGAELKNFAGHTNTVYSVRFSPDGRLLASGSGDKTIRFWQAAEGNDRRTLAGHTEKVLSVSFSPDVTLLASGSEDKTVRIWDAATGKQISVLPKYPITETPCIRFSPDGAMITAGGALWRVSDGTEIRTFGKLSITPSVSISPDGAIMAAGSMDSTITLWNVADGKEIRTLHGHDTVAGIVGYIYGLSFSPDGKILASASSDQTIKLWNVADGSEIRTLRGHAGWVQSVSFSPDGTLLVSGSADETIKLWTVADGSEIRTLRGHAGVVNSVSFSPNGSLLASGSSDQTIKLWKVADGVEIQTLRGHAGGVNSVSFSPDGMVLASGSDDNTIKFWPVMQADVVARGCAWLRDYLKFNPSLRDADRGWCAEEEIATYRQQIEIKSDHADAWNRLGVVLYAQGNLEEARAAFQKQVVITPDHADAWYNLGVLWEAQGNLEEALQAYQQQITVMPDHEKAWHNVGLAFQRQGKQDKALAAFQKHAEILQANGELDKAIAAYQTLLDVNPADEAALYQMARAFQQQDKLDEAIPAFQTLLKVNPAYPNAWNELGRAFQKQSKLDEALAAFKKQTETTPDHADAWNNLGLAFKQQGKLDNALAAFQKQTAVKPDHADAWFNLGDTLWKQGKVDDALKAFHQQLAVNPAHAMVFQEMKMIGFSLSMQGLFGDKKQIDSAISVFQTLLAMNPKQFDLWEVLGDICFQAKRLDDAIAAYQTLGDMKPDYKDVWKKLGDTFEERGNTDEAIAAYRKQVEVTPDHQDAWYKLGFTYQMHGKPEEALAAYQQQVAVNPTHQWAWGNMAMMYENQGKLDDAAAAWRKQAEAKSDHVYAWFNAGQILVKQGKYDDAIAAYKKQMEATPGSGFGSGVAWEGIGTALWKQGKLEEAAKVFADGLKSDQNCVGLLKSDAALALIQDNAAHAQERIDKALTLVEPDNQWFAIIPFYAWIINPAQGYDPVLIALSSMSPTTEFSQDFSLLTPALNRLDTATQQIAQQFIALFEGKNDLLSFCQKLLEGNPNQPHAWFLLGSVFDASGKSDEAISAFQKVVEMKPDYENAWFRLGNAFFHQQKWDEAITSYKEQLDRTPQNESAWMMYGYAFWKAGKLDEAATAFADGLKVNPKNLNLLSNDTELAFVQGDLKRSQQRIDATLPLVQAGSELFVVLSFYQWLSNPEQAWNQVLTAITQAPTAKFAGWDFSATTAALERLDADTQQAAQEFIAFFEGKIDLPTLKAQLEGR